MECSLYLHIPFCEAKCAYCDFYSVPLAAHSLKERDLLLNRYLDALLAETKKLLGEFPAVSIPTVYIGGGTPSLLGAGGIGRLLDGVGRLPGLSGGAEITLEANPESADAAFLEACRSGGIKRLSLGIQTFHEPGRQAVGRIGKAKLPEQRLAAAAEIFGEGLSLDLMTGLPLQTEAVLRADIEKALAFHPGHVSLYSLTLEEGTPLARKLQGTDRGCETAGLPGRDQADLLWLAGRDALVQAGYEQYEVSNFALPGRRCAHNIRYWRMEHWLGAGPAASGTIVGTPWGRRISYTPDLAAFFEAPAPAVEELDRDTLIRESRLMGFRYIEGPGPDLFTRRFGLSVEDAIPRTLESWRKKRSDGGEALAAEERAALTKEGLLFLNRFLLDAFAELDNSEGT
jgi:oxygen-independent coproporphyrinogen-3 oxidase